MEQPTLDFLASCGLAIARPNPRQYQARMAGQPGVTVLFQRMHDLIRQVAEGRVDLAAVGYDYVLEQDPELRNLVIVHPDLGYGRAEVVVAVPEAWVDVSTVDDLADVALELREAGRTLRVATSYPNLARRFLDEHGIMHFTLHVADGALEAAPSLGYADIIIDLTETGTSLRENRLKCLDDGRLLKTQACLIGNRRALTSDPQKREATRRILELIEAHLRAQQFVSLTANMRGRCEEEIARHVISHQATAGLTGPTIARVYAKSGDASDGLRWYSVTVVVRHDLALEAVEHFRRMGGSGITVSPARYVFEDRCEAFTRLLEELGVQRQEYERDRQRAHSLSD
jgi:ATP phosphoribosyltransferase